MNGHRHHIVGAEVGKSRPPVWAAAPPRRRLRRSLGEMLTLALIFTLLLFVGLLWLVVGPTIMRGH